ncbi:MAG TPA: DUF6520 family protein [Cyclobacteriaceae bacterium]|nr:DUF6520 family protein [Cyclobacteriaceae bacterium]
MKKISMVLSMVVFMLALGAAFATSSKKMLVTEVWRKPNMGGICAPTACLLTAPNPCGESGYTYFNNSSCTGTPVTPKKN